MKTALITGISGQDGSYMAEYLLSKGYKVIAIAHHALGEGDSKYKNYKSFLNDIEWKAYPLTAKKEVDAFLQTRVPDLVFHLGAQTFPSAGFDTDLNPFHSNCEGTYNLLSSVYTINPQARFFFAGSAEIFGDNSNLSMDENERFYPKTMYGISKLVGHELIRNYRDNLQKFALTGFLFNHESPRRGEEFVTRKITLAAARIKLGMQDKLVLGSLDSKRDWSAAEDFIEGFYLALTAKEAKDYVFSSGTLHTVGEFVDLAFKAVGLDYRKYIELDQRFNRPAKYDLKGNSSRAQNELGWKPKVKFETIVERMVKEDFDMLSTKING